MVSPLVVDVTVPSIWTDSLSDITPNVMSGPLQFLVVTNPYASTSALLITGQYNRQTSGSESIVILVPGKVSEGPVGFGHFVGIFALFNGSTGVVIGVYEFQG